VKLGAVLFLALTSCEPRVADPDLAAMLAWFGSAAGQTVRMPVVITPALPDGTAGFCKVGADGPYVQLNASYWSRAHAAERWVLVWHELGHCALGREHSIVFSSTEPNCPASIMYPSIAPVARCVGAVDYASELFSVAGAAAN
jgi:hypothetical protein